MDRANGRGDRLDPEEMRHLGLLYRQAAADLSLARRRYPDSPGTLRLDALVNAAHALVYGNPEDRALLDILHHALLAKGKRRGRCLAVSLSILVGFAVLGFFWAVFQPVAASGILPAGFHATTHPGQGGVVGIAIPARTGLAFEIFTNNIEVSVLALAGGFTLGLLTAYVLATNGAMLGVLAGLEWKAGAWEAFARLMVPHGLLELSCIAVAGSCRLPDHPGAGRPGSGGPRRGSPVHRAEARRHGSRCRRVASWSAGLTEGIVTTWDLPIGLALGGRTFWGGGFWALVCLARGPHTDDQPADMMWIRS